LAFRVGIDGRVLADTFPGIGRYVWGLLKALPAAAPDVELTALFDPRARNTRFVLQELVPLGLKLQALDVPTRSLGEQWQLPRSLRTLRLDVVHAPYPFTSLVCPTPRVLSLYDTTALDRHFGLQPWPRRWLAGLLLRSQARRAAALITLSRAAADGVVRHLGVPATRVHVVPPGVDPTLGQACDAAWAEARQHLALPPSYVLAVGTHKPHKNLTALLTAWGELQAVAADLPMLVLAGVGTLGATRLRAAHDLAALRVRVWPHVPEAMLPALYQQAMLLVVPSLDEGFGFTLLEGLAAGTPVLAADRGALPEVASTAAELFEPSDPAALPRALLALLTDTPRRRALAHSGPKRAAAFSWANSARTVADIYRAASRRDASGVLSGRAPAALARS
jgi:glycosyltransferase involved in cell wall biosynthesis